ncbi:MAG: Dam family site-specific DNA-(adenine-N6)-methyltransferase [Bacteroidetes bacterium]|nr:MAG: Dam family site-specific DNA-(adenine-N6)-methyltransferase [Bacteroidota bacterium]
MIIVPPIKSQGIKTKLVDWIRSSMEGVKYERWVEPFMGTGVVGFNLRPPKALMCDSNPHIIHFYHGIKTKEITASRVRKFLTKEGNKLLDSNGTYYYEVRSRFNEEGNPLDFLFLSRSCFNGMMRFNRKGGFNVPFCKKPNRFAQALVTKISNQVKNVAQLIELGDFTFKHQDFRQTLKEINESDLVYADPPYIGRHVDYFDSWSEEEERLLHNGLNQSKAKYMLSTWLSNKYRTNEYLFSIWKDSFISSKEHFYHVGGKEKNRNSVTEALISNVPLMHSIPTNSMKLRIARGESQLTSSKQRYPIPVQLSMNLQEEEPGRGLGGHS